MCQLRGERGKRSAGRLRWWFVVAAVLWLWSSAAWAGEETPAAPAKRPAAAPAKRLAAKAPAKRPAAKAPAREAAAAAPKTPAAARKAPSIRDKASNAFKAVDLNKVKHKAGWDRPYLLAAYGVVWLVLVFYIVGLARRLRQTDAELARMQRRLAALEEDE